MPRLPKERLTLGLLMVMLACGCAHAPEPAPTLDAFIPYLPNNSVTVPLWQEVRPGDVILVTFVSSWCFPCLADLVTLQKLEKEHHAQGFRNVLVGFDLDGEKTLRPFAEAYALSMPLLVSTERLRAGETPFGPIKELPSRFLFGRDGALRLGFSGVTRFEDLEREVVTALQQRQ